MAGNPNLPEEIVIEIFSRLPIRSLGRCRCLSTLWRSRLSNSQFLNFHFTRQPQKQSLFLITADNPLYEDHYRTMHTMAFPIAEEPVLKKLIDLPNSWVEVVGSIHGLVLVENRQGKLFLVNPLTREQVTIPNLSFYPWILQFRSNKLYGFGYDSSSNDYKIVALGKGMEVKDSRIGYEDSTAILVYSVKSGVWVRNYSFPPNVYVKFRASGAFVNGAIHWLGLDKRSRDSPPVIVAFDLASEEFRQVPGPVPAPNYANGAEFCNAYVLRGCLCIVESVGRWRDNFVVNVWMMKEYGLQESWVNFTLRFMKSGSHVIKPLCYIGEDEVVLVDQNTMSLLVSNVKEQTKKVILGNRDAVVDGCVFVESLLSPKELANTMS